MPFYNFYLTPVKAKASNGRLLLRIFGNKFLKISDKGGCEVLCGPLYHYNCYFYLNLPLAELVVG